MEKREIYHQEVDWGMIQQRKIPIPSWEKEFCLEVLGLFTWEHFLEAKQHTKNHYKVLRWDDSAAEEAFHVAKYRYFARIIDMDHEDMFIHEITSADYYLFKLRLDEQRAKFEKYDAEEDYRYYSQLIEQIRLGQATEV